MNNRQNIDDAEIDILHDTLRREAEQSGYHLNPDVEFTKDLVSGLITNQNRYGYWACPCRLADGVKEKDLDIICPCDYRDPDVNEFNTCYCGLYVSRAVIDGKKKISKIPERRPPEQERERARTRSPLPVWRCKVCGYLCAREQPPEVCPICKAKRERFERFM